MMRTFPICPRLGYARLFIFLAHHHVEIFIDFTIAFETSELHLFIREGFEVPLIFAYHFLQGPGTG